jgi:hypothetical protein
MKRQESPWLLLRRSKLQPGEYVKELTAPIVSQNPGRGQNQVSIKNEKLKM